MQLFYLLLLTLITLPSTTPYLITKNITLSNVTLPSPSHTSLFSQQSNLAQVFRSISNTSFGSITGEAIFWNISDYLTRGGEDYVGKVLFVDWDYSYDDVAVFMEVEFLAVVIFTTIVDPGMLSLSKGYLARREAYDVLAFQVTTYVEGYDVWFDVLKQGDLRMFVVITDEGNENNWEMFAESAFVLVFQIVLVGFALVNVVLCVYKLVYYFKTGKSFCSLHLAKIVLAAELVSNLFRMLYLGYDPINIRQLTELEFSYYLALVSAPVSIATTVGVLWHWNVITQQPKEYLQCMRPPVIAFVCIILSFGFLAILMQWIIPRVFIIVTLTSLVYTAASVLLCIYTFYTVPKIWASIKNLPFKKEMEKKTLLIAASGILSFLWCFPPFTFMFLSVTFASFWITIFFVWFLLLLGISFTQILVFQSKSKKGSKKTNIVNIKTGSGKVST
eukprot:TRINITY_DN9060_c0_g1_i1.p1 TRINITY_DN9060_c0_g1~~TRINITY_DN9060_c0_g1_i1.p1  ORF type:complete len:473 (+),score=58.26 TRINITY_DN9060_c0_g1_i1:82-1419(+)